MTTNIINAKEKGNFVCDDLSLILMTTDDVELVYHDLYCKNNSFIDSHVLDMPILSNHVLDKCDFLEVLKEKNVFSFITIHRQIKIPKGFITFRKNKETKSIEIVFLEAWDKNPQIIRFLLNAIAEKAREFEYKEITLNVVDGEWGKMQTAICHGFIKIKTKYTQGQPDVYSYKLQLNSKSTS